MVERGLDVRSHPGEDKLIGAGGQEGIEEREERQLWSCWFEEFARMRAQK